MRKPQIGTTLCIVNGEKRQATSVQMTYTMLPELKTCERGHLKSQRIPAQCATRCLLLWPGETIAVCNNTAEILLLGNNVEDECLK